MTKPIYNTKLFTIVALLTVVLGACSKVETTPSSLDGKKREMVRAEMGAITMDAGIETKAATATTPMAVSSTFRLYAFEKGKTSIEDLVATHTYTISSTEPGLPVKDKPDELLYLPVGEVDIYLVGPVDVEETTIIPAIPPSGENAGVPEQKVVAKHKIAHETGVSPRYGCDLVASKSTVTIVAGEKNEITLNALRHRMARMNIEVYRKEGATYTDLDVKEMKVYNQATTSSFTFGEDGGEITPVVGTENVIAKKDAITEVTKGERYTTTLYMIPRPEEDMKIEVNFTCKLVGSSELIDKRLESGLIRASLVGGKQNYFWSNPVISSNILWRTRILPWNDVANGETTIVTDEDLIFSYSALDAPITIDGEKYWRDRSGNGRHAKIVGDIIYDAVNKCYMSSAEGISHFLIPELGVMGEYSMEVSTESTRSPSSAMFLFDPGYNARALGIYLPWVSNRVLFDIGGAIEGVTRQDVYLSESDKAFMENFATYFFTIDNANSAVIGRNGTIMKKSTLSKVDRLPFKNNKMLVGDGSGGTYTKIRLYTARMYKKAITADVSKQHYEADMSTFCGFNTKGDDSEYISGGLILNLDGTNPGSSPTTQWEDKSGYNNHAKLNTVSGYPQYVSGSKGYNFNANNGYLRLAHSLGKLQNYTVEYVAKNSVDNGRTGSMIYFSDKETVDSRIFNVNYPWSGKLYFDAIFAVPGYTNVRNTPSIADLPYSNLMSTNQWSVSRENNKSKGFILYENGIYANAVDTHNETLPDMRCCIIGRRNLGNNNVTEAYNGIIYSVRVYNRILTEKERRHNYLVDKKKYGIL